MSTEDHGPAEPPALHELEAEVMDLIWIGRECTVRQVMDAANARAVRPRAYTTYMTVMSRLAAKGLLERRRDGRTDIYRASLSRDEYASRSARAALDSIVNVFGELALAHIAHQAAELDPERRHALERLARER